MKELIYINDFLPAFISNRNALSSITEHVKFFPEKHYIFDFTNITFISRSFTDAFLKYLKQGEVQWEISNANQNIISMIEAVQKSQAAPRSYYDYVAVTSFSNKRDLNQFLSTF